MAFISIVEMIGTVAFAMAGALTAIEKDLDYYGIGIFAITTSVGGGIVRDLLIDRPLPASLENPLYALISLLSAGFVILFYTHITKLSRMLQFFDAIGLGAFTAIGAEVAVQMGFQQWYVVVTLAVLTGTGGGLIRDVFAREIPYVFRKEVYALASILGAILYIFVYQLAGSQIALYSCFLATVLIRIYCMENDVHLLRVGKVNLE
ncbi:trimeric intracellular cation channel family protein [Trichococcus ilyis]|uniref:Uncharacterized membrane protein YeiH n=1 Tax=Trichococcus ilyis TaxID=640938 RepID=A0A143YNC1_9LACT|nr:trimeric intracellular cation channel family protein [Trichococcus ilyis]CZQ92561.1 Hypothetical protein TR210_1058 [Trichococcus ilyis]SEI94929.1 Uncharacterized membrane protein YeiH [Trichococcus ilyis]